MKEKPRSVYVRGAEDGLILGPVLAFAVVLTGLTAYHPWVFIPMVICLIAVPTVTFILLKRSYTADGCRTAMSALWLEGICAFFFGGLIMTLVAYVGMRWAYPAFIPDQFRSVIDAYSSLDTPQAQQLADMLRRAVEARALPTPFEMALELLYGAVFSGSLLSALLALTLRRRRSQTPPTPPIR